MSTSGESIIVEVEPRTEFGTGPNRRLRAAGKVPGNVYGLDAAPFAVAVDPRVVEHILDTGSGRNTIFKLSTGSGKQTRSVMLREIQRDPLSERILHIDFVRFDPTKKIHVKVPVRLVGTAVGVKNEGGVVDFVHREVEVECLPARIPEHLDVDISGLHTNQHVAVKDLTHDDDVRILDDEEAILAVVGEPRKEVVPVAEAEEAAAPEEGEPEVVGKEAEAASSEKEGGEK